MYITRQMHGTLIQCIGKEKKYMHFSIKIHTQNMGQDNNSPAANVHNTTSGTLGQFIEK